MTELQKYFKNEVMESMSKTIDSMYANGDEDSVIKMKSYVEAKRQPIACDAEEVETPQEVKRRPSKPKAKTVAVAPSVDGDYTAEELNAMNDKQLCVVLKELGIAGKSKAKKTEKIDVILSHQDGEELPQSPAPASAPVEPMTEAVESAPVKKRRPRRK